VGLFPRWLRWLPANRMGAVAAKELRLQWREPRRRAQLISAGFFALLPLFSLRASGGLGHASVLIAAFPAMIFGIAALNQYAFDGPRFWMHLAAGDDARADLLGKNIETALVSMPIACAVAVVVAALTGGWAYVVPVIVLAGLAVGVQLGIGNVTSVIMPVALPDSGTSAWANNTAQGMQVIVPALLGMLVTGVLIGPFVALTGFLGAKPVILAVMAVEVALGWGAWRLGLRIALRRSATRQPELLAQLSRLRGT
jgi:ABC-2 type transport system permease protein